MNSCLACLRSLTDENKRYHQKCLDEFWQEDPPVLELEYELSELEELARENIAKRIIVPGVQPKLSLGFGHGQNNRLTIVGALDGRYILKPPHKDYPQMPEMESVSMHLARACGIDTVPFLLIPLKGGELAYLTRRIDRDGKGNKIAMEDACQFTERLTEHKYRGSYEQIAKAILKYNGNRLLDVVRFYEQVVFSYFIGNNDMHLKNFSLIAKDHIAYKLSPAYDMLAVQLLIPEDDEDLALTLNGKKKKLKKHDFYSSMLASGIPDRAIENLWARIELGLENGKSLIKSSFIDNYLKIKIQDMLLLKGFKLKGK